VICLTPLNTPNRGDKGPLGLGCAATRSSLGPHAIQTNATEAYHLIRELSNVCGLLDQSLRPKVSVWSQSHKQFIINIVALMTAT
jgi:hypothetical protein